MTDSKKRHLKKIYEVTNEDVEISWLIEDRRNTARREKQHLNEVSKQIRKCIRDKKRSKRQENVQRILEVSRKYLALNQRRRE